MSDIRDSFGVLTFDWADMVGKTGEEVKAIIQNQNPSMDVVLLSEGQIVTMDYRQDRVLIYTNGDGRVDRIPRIG